MASLVHDRFRRDVLWNLAGTAVLGVSGIALNVLVGRHYGPETFGVFSQVLAVHYVLSQLSVGGFGFSALAICAEQPEERERARHVLAAAVTLAAGLAALVCAAALLAHGAIGRLFDSPGVGVGILWALPGLWLLAVDKVLLFGLNGLGWMRACAIFLGSRYLLIVSAAAALALGGAPGTALPAALSLGELALSVALVAYLWRAGLLAFALPSRAWLERHLRFGNRTFFSGLLLDVNPKVDVLMLGYFASDRVVGVYGFASMLAEGLHQILWVVQTNLAPVLSRLRAEGRGHEVRALVRRNVRLLPPALLAVSIPVAALYAPAARWLVADEAFAEGWIYFAVLAAGIAAGSSYLPFGVLLNQWGHPGWFMAYLAALVAANVALNALLIPAFGALGAALGTAGACVLAIALLKGFARAATGQRI